MAWAYQHTGLRGAALCEVTAWLHCGMLRRLGLTHG